MGSKTILQYFQEHTNASNVIFISGQYEFRIIKGTDGTITAKHNFALVSSGTWTNIPDAWTLEAQQHISDHGRISNILVKDTEGNEVFQMANEPQLVVF